MTATVEALTELGHTPLADVSKAEACDDFVKSRSWRVEDVMTTPVITVGEGDTVEEIARLFDVRKIKRAPVIRDGHLVGVVSRADLLGVIARSKPPAIARGDDALRLSVVSRLREALQMARPPAVSVIDGVVHLGGTVRSENERRVIRAIVDGVPGSSGVDDHMLIEPTAEGSQTSGRIDDGEIK